MGLHFVAETVSLCALVISMTAVAVSTWQARLAKRQVFHAERQAHAAEMQAEQALAQAEYSKVQAEAAKAALDIATGQYNLEQYRGSMARREVQLSYLAQINMALHEAVKSACEARQARWLMTMRPFHLTRGKAFSGSVDEYREICHAVWPFLTNADAAWDVWREAETAITAIQEQLPTLDSWHIGDGSRRELAIAMEKLDSAIASLEKCRGRYLDCT
jgi:hypothetical protein